MRQIYRFFIDLACYKTSRDKYSLLQKQILQRFQLAEKRKTPLN